MSYGYIARTQTILEHFGCLKSQEEMHKCRTREFDLYLCMNVHTHINGI